MSADHKLVVAVDRSTCIGNGVCVSLAPLAFSLDASMKAAVTHPERESYESLVAAAESCPVQAIFLSEDGEPIYP